MRKALGTLPWVEQDSIVTIVKTREVGFNLKDKKGFNEEEIGSALSAQNFKQFSVKTAPPK